ncbi:MAG: efflux RND transporter periplasmic adaptor subunit [Candidatus Latescibacteria bacterium]|nr:efflux RND transporter periplasmic adaptor subunit [bacterium]MBD3424665.1 efflux RND transporter periplasmic adaptor subunit [Candidatus Latescibacterota bacterium]
MSRGKSLITAGIIIIAGIILSAVLTSQKEPVGRRSRPGNVPETRTIISEKSDIRATVTLSGPLTALDRIDVYAEVSGVLQPTGKRFKPGNSFEKGETLVLIDDSVYRNNLLAQKSSLLNQLTVLLPDLSIDFPPSADKWKSYLKSFRLEKPLPPLPEAGSEKERYYIASHNIYNLYYTIKSMESTLAKYRIRAPYDGVVTSSNINPGTLVRQGQKMGEFISTDQYEMRGSADPEVAELLSVGMPAEMTCYDLPGNFRGTISRINSVIDRNTQTVEVFITTGDSRLREGLYMNASIQSRILEDVTVVPGKAMAGMGQVWILNDSTLHRADVKVIAVQEEEVIIRGLDEGTMIVTEPPAKAYEGMTLKQRSSGEKGEPGTGPESGKGRPGENPEKKKSG